MLILNQDHDRLYDFSGELHTFPVVSEGHLLGVNLYTSNALLGTFDSTAEAIEEMGKIRRCNEEVYTVNGFSDFDIIKGLNHEAD